MNIQNCSNVVTFIYTNRPLQISASSKKSLKPIYWVKKISCFRRTLKDLRFTTNTTKLKFWPASKSRFTNYQKGKQQDLCFLYSSTNKRWQWFSINIHWTVKCVNQDLGTSNLSKNKRSFHIWYDTESTCSWTYTHTHKSRTLNTHYECASK